MQKNEKQSGEIFDYDKYMADSKSSGNSTKKKKNQKKKNRNNAPAVKPLEKKPVKEASAEEIKVEAPVEEALSVDDILNEIPEEKAPAKEEAIEKEPEPEAEEPLSAEAAEAVRAIEEASKVKEEVPAEEESGKSSRRKKKKRSEPKHEPEHILQALDDALDEDVSEIEEVAKTEEVQIPQSKGGFKRKMYFTIGVAVSVMAVIGFIFTVNFLVGVAQNIVDNTAQKNEFAKLVYPLVIIDTAPFDTSSQLSSDSVLTAAIWDIILYGDTSKYPKEFDIMTIPEIDVELHATNLLGTGLVFEHGDLGSSEVGFYYDAETKSYTVPVSPKYFPYSPYIESVKKTGENYSLKVGYVSPNPAWLGTDKNEVPTPDKYMEYIVHKNGKNYTVVAIHEVEEWYKPSDY